VICTRYPAHLIDVVRVADGSRITIRPTLPQDVELQRVFFRMLSAESRYSRFMTPLRELPDTLAERFTNIDYRRHLALLAEVFDEAGQEIMIGEARYVVDERNPTTCEFAIAIADEWQSHGIALALLERLERQAAASGIHRMIGDTLITNKAMQGLASRAGFSIRASLEDAEVWRLEKMLAGSSGVPVARPLAA
jgi:acetyltransferase